MTEWNVRRVVLDCLMAVTEDGIFSHETLNRARDKYAWFSSEDRAFLNKTVHGTLEYLVQIDAILDQYSSLPVRKMKPVVRNILRMAVYQLLYMDRIPPHAVTNEAVRLTERRGYRGLKGFVNALTRTIAAERVEILDSLRQSDALWKRYSIPIWLAKKLEGQYGRERTEEIFSAFLKEKTVSLVPCAPDSEIRDQSRSLLLAGGWRSNELCPVLYTADGQTEEGRTLLREGLAFAQDLSSALAVQAAAPEAGESVLDLCAAPGGKSMAAALYMEGRGQIHSFDLLEQKVEVIRDNAVRCGWNRIISPSQQDASMYRRELAETADLVIADLPCSGLGVIGRKPDIKQNVSEKGIFALSQLQKTMLRNAASYVKPGGRLLFSTCTMVREENEENLDWLLRECPALRPMDLRRRLPKLYERMKTIRTEAAQAMAEGRLQLLPQDLGSDGFFFSMLKKEGREA